MTPEPSTTPRHGPVDIRKIFPDITNAKEQLKVDWPIGKKDQEPAGSGINCLLLLLKPLYRHVNFPFWNIHDKSMHQLEQTNAFMAQAWLQYNLGHDHSSALDSISLALFREPFQMASNVHCEELTVSRLLNCDMMRKFWSLKELYPFMPTLWKVQTSVNWYKVDGSTPSAVSQIHWCPYPNPSSFCIAASPDTCLDTEVCKLFGQFQAENLAILARPAATRFFYVSFRVTGVTNAKKLDFDAFRGFNLNIGKLFAENSQWTWRETGQVPYRLIAIIRPRQSIDACDTIRVYEKSGENILSRIEAVGGYASPTWRLRDLYNGELFFAVYVKSSMAPSRRPAFPEVAHVSGSDFATVAQRAMDRL